jgi:hypothetical protein
MKANYHSSREETAAIVINNAKKETEAQVEPRKLVGVFFRFNLEKQLKP